MTIVLLHDGRKMVLNDPRALYGKWKTLFHNLSQLLNKCNKSKRKADVNVHGASPHWPSLLSIHKYKKNKIGRSRFEGIHKTDDELMRKLRNARYLWSVPP